MVITFDDSTYIYTHPTKTRSSKTNMGRKFVNEGTHSNDFKKSDTHRKFQQVQHINSLKKPSIRAYVLEGQA